MDNKKTHTPITGGASSMAKKNCAVCFNCGELIYPDTQVGVMMGENGERLYCHTTFECSPAGNTFYGYWGEGELVSSFENVEQC